MLAEDFDSDISVPNMFGFYVTKAKKGLNFPKISGNFALATAGFKPGEHLPRKRLILCLFLSSNYSSKSFQNV